MYDLAELKAAISQLKDARLYGDSVADDRCLVVVLKAAANLGWIPDDPEYDKYLQKD